MDDSSSSAVRPADEPTGPYSIGDVSVVSGPAVTLWATPPTSRDTAPLSRLRLEARRPAIVGRQEGGTIDYLDPAYRPTQVVPDSGQRVLRPGGGPEDGLVSRGHFMLRAAPCGIVLVNGVPRAGGGIRPPVNGTWLVFPVRRRLAPGEEYLIERGAVVVIRLPNASQLRIGAC
jgi:hypothetical protein